MPDQDDLRSTPYWDVENDSWAPGSGGAGQPSLPLDLGPDKFQVDSTGSVTINSEAATLPLDVSVNGVRILYVDENGLHGASTIIDTNIGSWGVTTEDLEATLISANDDGYISLQGRTGFAALQVAPDGGVFAYQLPTSDPHASGQLWNNAGTLKISSG